MCRILLFKHSYKNQWTWIYQSLLSINLLTTKYTWCWSSCLRREYCIAQSLLSSPVHHSSMASLTTLLGTIQSLSKRLSLPLPDIAPLKVGCILSKTRVGANQCLSHLVGHSRGRGRVSHGGEGPRSLSGGRGGEAGWGRFRALCQQNAATAARLTVCQNHRREGLWWSC